LVVHLGIISFWCLYDWFPPLLRGDRSDRNFVHRQPPGALTAGVIVFVASFFAMAIPDKHLATDTQEAQRSTFLKMVVMTVILGLTCYFVKGLFVLFMLAFYVTLIHRTNKLNWRVVFGKGE